MPSAHYAPLSTNPNVDGATREMEDAFGDDDDEDEHDSHESTPLTRRHAQEPSLISGTYDFERDYDYTQPPPGSPPGPSATALPNNYGNSNGMLPMAPVIEPSRGPSFFRRAVGSLLPTHYQRVATEAPTARTVGGGVENDGVFANVMAKPVRGARNVRAEDGSVYLAPEETQKEQPPVRNLPTHLRKQTNPQVVIRRSPNRFSTTLLGNHRPRTIRRNGRHDRRRPAHRKCHDLCIQPLHLFLLPILWIHHHVLLEHYTCCQVRLSRRAWSDVHPVWSVLARG